MTIRLVSDFDETKKFMYILMKNLVDFYEKHEGLIKRLNFDNCGHYYDPLNFNSDIDGNISNEKLNIMDVEGSSFKKQYQFVSVFRGITQMTSEDGRYVICSNPIALRR